MKQMRQVVKNTNNRPVRRPMADRDQRGERQQRQVAERARAAVRDPSACDHWRRRLLSSFGPRASAADAPHTGAFAGFALAASTLNYTVTPR